MRQLKHAEVFAFVSETELAAKSIAIDIAD